MMHDAGVVGTVGNPGKGRRQSRLTDEQAGTRCLNFGKSARIF